MYLLRFLSTHQITSPLFSGFASPALLMLSRSVFILKVLCVVTFASLGIGCGAVETPAPVVPAVSSSQAAPFTDITESAGVDFVHANGMTGVRYFVEMTGSGTALFDYDNDGDLDLYLVQGHPLGPSALAEQRPTDRLYRNDLAERGTLAFTDVTTQSGLRADGYGIGVATGDYNNDGYVDLYLTNWGANQLWRNNGDGTFTDVTQASGTNDPRWSAGATFFDFDRDGWLDLMVVNYENYSYANDHPCYAPTGVRDYCGPSAYPPEPDRLLRNRGDGTFEDVTLRLGLTAAYGPGLGVVAADFNSDGWPDLYVTNDGQENQLWINQRDMGFVNNAVMAGTAVNAAGQAEASMGITAADFDNDGDDDLFMTHLAQETNTLYLNAGNAQFEDQTRRSGLGLASRPYTAFGLAPLDYDNDGHLDLFIANGEVKIIREQAEQGDPLPLRQPNQLFHNRGNGRFEDVTPQDSLFALAEVSRGVATGDLDNDGDTDIVLTNNNGPARLLRNTMGAAKNWLGLRLISSDAARDLPGTRVALHRLDGTTLWRHVHTDGSYASASDPRILFGLGEDGTYETVRVIWPDGSVETWNDLALRKYHTLTQGQGQATNP